MGLVECSLIDKLGVVSFANVWLVTTDVSLTGIDSEMKNGLRKLTELISHLPNLPSGIFMVVVVGVGLSPLSVAIK